jgi:hypothetical protein
MRLFSMASLMLALLLASVGCMTTQRVTTAFKESLGMAQPNPAALLITTFEPSLYHLPDPTKDGQLRPGLAGMMYLVDKDGQFTDVNGTFTVFVEDITPRPQGVSPAIAEVWEFDAETLKKLKSSHEKFGKNTVIFLPWPDNWKSVTTLRISTQYDPAAGSGGVRLTGPVQPLSVDFNSPGRPLWTEKNEPFVMRGVPNVKRDMAKGFTAANNSMPQMAAAPAQANTMNAGLMQPQQQYQQQQQVPMQTSPALQLPPQQPMHGVPGPFPTMTQPNQKPAIGPNTLPDLPPTTAFDPRNPTINTQPGADGSMIRTTAMALPAGQTVPAGWVQMADKSVVPMATKDPGIVTLPVTNPYAAQNQQPLPPPNVNWPPASVNTVPATPVTTVPVPSNNWQVSGRIERPVQPMNFDPRSTVGTWASTPASPGQPVDPNAQLRTVTIPAGQR